MREKKQILVEQDVDVGFIKTQPSILMATSLFQLSGTKSLVEDFTLA